MIDNNDQAVRARIRFDWGMGPFWIQFSGDPIFYDYDTEEISEVLTLSKELLSDIEKWNARMQDTFDYKEGRNSGIEDPAERGKWAEDGRVLAVRLKREVGSAIAVEYSPFGDTGEEIDA
ncbi:hypothetical protein SAXI111661_16620 [Saccharomonospora xinjiangensis]|uniref:hypothetical protein n=1 Tax=Saccharomonospora xinjiangensis TaxID=75294 RepID=UPI00106FF72B|nr:hypothetical protein [Saccharomonospora xinjiangensis]QBQ62463.1 hypothetical protein EYD13_20670 [Saccharomonospora xinjiangensis]